MADGVRRACANCSVDLVPIADGGEGTVDCLIAAVDGETVNVQVHDPLGRLINARYGVLASGTTVIDEGRTSFVVGLGGSATNDAGIGMFNALDKFGIELPPTPEAAILANACGL